MENTIKGEENQQLTKFSTLKTTYTGTLQMDTLTPDALKAYRTENDLSQEEFAKRAGVAPSTISRFESGAGNLSEETAAKVSEYMTQTTKDESATPVTPEDTPIGNILDDSLINTTANQIIEKLIEYSETTVEVHMKTVRIPSAALFTKDYTFGEIEKMLIKAEKELANKVKSTVRDRLDRIKHSA